MLDPLTATLIAGGISGGLGLLAGDEDPGEFQPMTTLTTGQQELLNALTGQLTPSVGQGLTPVGAPQIAPFGQFQQQAFGLAGGIAPGVQAGFQGFGGFDPQQAQGILGQGIQGLQPALAGFDPSGILSALEPSQELARREFQQNIIPNILERFGATSGASGALNRQLAETGSNFALGLGAQAGQALLGGRESALNRQAQAGLGIAGLAGVPGALAGQGQQLGQAGLGQLLGIGGLQQAQQQQILDAQRAGLLEPRQILSQFGPLALGTSAIQNVFQPGTPPSALQSLAASGAGAFGGAAVGAQGIGGAQGTGFLGGLFG